MPKKRDERFFDVAAKAHYLLRECLPKEIVDDLRTSTTEKDWHPKRKESWFTVYGNNPRECPRFWNDDVTNYFIARRFSGGPWMVGFHFSPDHNTKTAGGDYSDGVGMILGKVFGKEGFEDRSFQTQRDTEKVFIVADVADGADVANDIAAKLAWLIRQTWPSFRTMIQARAK